LCNGFATACDARAAFDSLDSQRVQRRLPMTLNLSLKADKPTVDAPRITVIGVGGGGTNAVNNMIAMGLSGVEFLVCNTDSQSLAHSPAHKRVHLGQHLTQGLGAGAKPEIGRAAAEEAGDEIGRQLEGVQMAFVTAGMGGGTGTGAAPVVARMARERGVLTVGVVTRPFEFEGRKRRAIAESGIEELQQYVDTLIVIPNQNLFRLANERTTFEEAFKMADNVLYMGVRGITDLMVVPGAVNLDFADIRTIMAEMGKAMMGTGEAEGEERAKKAAESAISNPLLEDSSIRGAKGVLINITGGRDMTLFEVDEAANRIRDQVDEDANIIFGTAIDETLNGRLRVSVVATGIDVAERVAQRPQLVVNGGPVDAVASAVIAAPRMAPRPAVVASMPAPTALRPAGVAHLRQPVAFTEAAPQPEPAPAPAVPEVVPVEAMARPIATMAPVPAAPQSAFRRLFQQATGLGGMRRTLPASPAPAPARQEPDLAPRAVPRAGAQEEMGLDIPTFLRRQSNQ
jgi:cell division protein FtsZ